MSTVTKLRNLNHIDPKHRAKVRKLLDRIAVAPERRAKAEAAFKKLRLRDFHGRFRWLCEYMDVVQEDCWSDPAGYGLQVWWALEDYYDAYGDEIDEVWRRQLMDLTARVASCQIE